MTSLTPAMTKALEKAASHGGYLIRYPGGYWTYQGVKRWSGIPEWCVGTTTVEALVKRGALEYVGWQQGRRGKFPTKAAITAGMKEISGCQAATQQEVT